MVQDVNLKGVQRKDAQRTGDITGIQVKDAKKMAWSIFIEAKNGTDESKLRSGLIKFFKHANNRNTTHEIFIYLSYHEFKKPPVEPYFEKTTNKLFLIINGIRKRD